MHQPPNRPVARSRVQGAAKLRLFLLTGGWLGYLGPAPGSPGSLPPPLFALLLVWLLGSPQWTWASLISLNVSIALLGTAFAIVCLRFGEEAEQHFNKKDPRPVVADEIAGQSIALLFLPWRAGAEPGAFMANLAMAATAFVAFRVLDVIKPPPARSLQRLKAGAGILVDDLIAGVYALIVTQIMAWFVWPAVIA